MEKNSEVGCPRCKSKNVNFVSRITGYYSVVKNWSNSKVQELKARENGDYSLSVKDTSEDLSK